MKYSSRKNTITITILIDDSNRRDQIINDPAFARTRENMSEFGGCGTAVKAIRHGFSNLLPDYTDALFTARLMSLAKEVNRRDFEGIRGKRSILFSVNRPLFCDLAFKAVRSIAYVIQNFLVCTHPITRIEATMTVTGLAIKSVNVPKGATHFRVQNHLSIISDYSYSEGNRRYEPVSLVNGLSAFAFSEYTPVGTALTEVVTAAFPVDTDLAENCSVIQCVGIEFSIMTAGDVYLPIKGSSIMVNDVF